LGRGRQYECVTSAFLDLAVEVFAAIGGSQTLSVGFWEGEDGKAIKAIREVSSAQAASLGCIPSRFDEDLETFLFV
jgi:hypothetical protein